jgi:hypothetical protein
MPRAHDHPPREAPGYGKMIKAGCQPTRRETSQAGLTLPAAIHPEELSRTKPGRSPRLTETPELGDQRAAALRASRAVTRADSAICLCRGAHRSGRVSRSA